MRNRMMDVLMSHPHIGRMIGDVCYDKDDNIVEVDESVVQAYIAANDYKEQRRTAYPSVVDQLDTLYHGGYDAWKATIKQVKDDIPKP
jgi:rhodanese-related sulfurtransferase